MSAESENISKTEHMIAHAALISVDLKSSSLPLFSLRKENFELLFI